MAQAQMQQAPATAEKTQPSAAQQPAQSTMQENAMPVEGSKSKWWLWLIIAVVIIAIGVGIYYWLK